MKFITLKVLILFLLIGMISVADAASISGVVTDANTGLPVDSTIVRTVGSNPITRDSVFYSTITEADGSYILENVIPATYYLWCQHPNYLSASQSDVVVSDSLSDVTVDFTLTPIGGGPTNYIGGVVFSTSRVNPIGNGPLAGANVHLSSNGTFFDATSDSGGIYCFSDIPTGLYTLSADAPNHIPQPFIDSLWIDDNTNIRNLDIYLVSLDTTTTFSSLSGYVYEADSMGTPVDSALIELYPSNPMMSWVYSAYTNPDGSYQIDNIEPDVYYAVCQASGFLPGREYGIDLTLGNATQDFYLLPDTGSVATATLTGFVWQDSVGRPPALPGVPLYPATIWVLGYNSFGDSLMYSTDNNQDGSYTLPGIIPGTYTVICTSPGFQNEYVHDFIIDDSLVMLDFNMSSANPVQNGYISGSVYSDSSGSPVAGAFIEFIALNGYNYFAFSDANGNYESPELPAGDYYVACNIMSRDSNFFYIEYYDDAHTISNATVLFVTENDSISGINFGIPTSTSPVNVVVNGNVSDSNNQPLANALVTAWSFRNPMSPGDSLYMSTYTNAQGNYTLNINNNTPQYGYSFFMSAEKQGYNIEFWQEKATPWEADPIWVTGDSAITGINFTLDAISNTNSISGSIIDDARYTPINNAFIVAADLANAQIYFTFSDSVGYYNFSNLSEGYYYLLFTANGYAPEFYDDVYLWEDATPVYASGSVTGIDAGLAGLNTNPSNGRISGTVIDNNSQPLSGVLLAIKNDAGDVIGYDITDNQGVYEVNGIIDGNHSISATKVSYSSETQNVTYNSTVHNTLVVNFDLDLTLTGVPKPPENIIPMEIALMPNYPNPFNPVTTIEFALPKAQKVKIEIYNTFGQKIETLVSQGYDAGIHKVQWNASQYASGIYFYKMETENFTKTNKLILIK